MTIKIGVKSAVIILLAVCVLVSGLYHYRTRQGEQIAVQLRQTGQILSQLTFPVQVASELQRLGWNVRVPELPQPVPEQGQ